MLLVGPPPDHIIETEIDGDISLYDPSRAEVLVLNSTASDIWRLSDGHYTLGGLVSALAHAYQTDPSSIRPEVEATIHDLVDRGFLLQAESA